uniref:Cullin-2 n=1 Tax=Syphacia muris TaxID=451379 RepID=A0A158R5K3_9BILA
MAYFTLRPKPVDFNEIWDGLRTTLQKLLNLQPLDRRSWDDNFYDIYALCVAVPEPLSAQLYAKTKEFLEEHVAKLYQNICTGSEASDEYLLFEYYKHWKVYHEGTTYIHKLFIYLNKQFVRTKHQAEVEGPYCGYNQYLPQNEVMEIGPLALYIWRENAIKPIEDRLVRQLLNAIAADRRNVFYVPANIVHDVIMSFIQVDDVGLLRDSIDKPSYTKDVTYDTYRNMFEKKFLHETKVYYTLLSNSLINELSCSEYMEKVIECIDKENERSRRYLHEISYEVVTRLCREVMVSEHKDKLHSLCRELIRTEQRHDLHNMYSLLQPIQGLGVVVREFEAFVKQTGLDAVRNLQGDNVPQQFVDNVLQVYNKFYAMVAEVFADDGDFIGALDKALQAVVNHWEGQKPKASERLARYTDTLLRKSAKGLSEYEIDARLSQAIIIFRYIDEKDIFQKFYSKMLANRLITNASVSKDAEESMINKLKQACGFEFTSKLSRMFTDIGLSHDLTQKFIEETPKLKEQMQVLVLQAGAWPLSPTQSQENYEKDQVKTTFNIPSMLHPSIQQFEDFYHHSHNGRKLTWLFNLSSGMNFVEQIELKLLYLDKVCIVTMTVHQFAILSAFAVENKLDVSKIGDLSGLSGDLLYKNIRALVDAGILLAAEKESIHDNTEISLNMGLSTKRTRIKVMSPQIQRQVEKEVEHVNNTVMQDRKYHMECTIVRIMKTRKVMKHAALVNEVIEQTKERFIPDINFIKKNIEGLIEKLYLQRTDQADEYQYLA